VHSACILSAGSIDVGTLPSEVRQQRRSPEPRDEHGVLRVEAGTPIADVERRLILATLAQCGGSKARAAEQLGISLKTLYNRLHTYEASGDQMPEDTTESSDAALP
jgi:DNA-binding NtrC family response regulator